MRDAEPILNVAQLAHVELLTPKPDQTLRFFAELLGMRETARAGGSVYLRAYEDFYHHTLKITEAPQPGLGHVAWRAMSRPALERRVAAIEASDLGRGWSDGDLGHGPAYRFATPDGHPMELLWDVEYYRAPEAERSLLKSDRSSTPTYTRSARTGRCRPRRSATPSRSCAPPSRRWTGTTSRAAWSAAIAGAVFLTEKQKRAVLWDNAQRL